MRMLPFAAFYCNFLYNLRLNQCFWIYRWFFSVEFEKCKIDFIGIKFFYWIFIAMCVFFLFIFPSVFSHSFEESQKFWIFSKCSSDSKAFLQLLILIFWFFCFPIVLLYPNTMLIWLFGLLIPASFDSLFIRLECCWEKSAVARYFASQSMEFDLVWVCWSNALVISGSMIRFCWWCSLERTNFTFISDTLNFISSRMSDRKLLKMADFLCSSHCCMVKISSFGNSSL